MTIAEAARQNRVSEQSVSRWKAQFMAGGRSRGPFHRGRRVTRSTGLPGPRP
ncbi:hypothetical protein LWC34_12620 [Kibdelosporangium philippinense]|uniref:Helix-turn-helix domain-containing protein n=1 Tax=Kibdelosporangium philippinense TaxID=211113 RepID=A0ABS8ZAV8_9PSEU|nr:hypothetical protein [Kibdelosporangium philippinense]MCE7003663.1 hypothetical protein [Kibdelosporangium philippinense]